MRPMSVRSSVATMVSMSAVASALCLSACGDSGRGDPSSGSLVEVAQSPANEALIGSAQASDEVRAKLEALHQAGWTGGDHGTPVANSRGDLAVGFHLTGPAADTALDVLYVPVAMGDSNVLVRPSTPASATLFAQTINSVKDAVPADDSVSALPQGEALEVGATVSAATTCGRLSAGQALTTNQTLYSCHNGYRLIMQKDGNAVSYYGSTATWSSRTNGKGGVRLIMQSDGNLVVYTSGGTALWASHTNGNSGAYFRLQDDGNLVVYSSGGKALWSSGTYCDSGCTGACRGWTCSYASSLASCPWCGDGESNSNPCYQETIRSGHTDSSHCVGVYADYEGHGVSCPSPNKYLSYLICGEP